MFPRTRHSVIARLGSPDERERRLAWDALAAAYWKPVYKYLRARWRVPPETAEDLTQEFFGRAVEKGFLARYDPSVARFRTWLRTCVDGLVANELKAAARLKRGGRMPAVPLDFATAEGEVRELAIEADVDLDRWFHQEFVRALFERAVAAVGADYAARGRADHFALFEECDLADLAEGERPSYRALAEARGWAVHDVTNRLAAVRRDLRATVLRLLRETCVSEEEYQREARETLGIDP